MTYEMNTKCSSNPASQQHSLQEVPNTRKMILADLADLKPESRQSEIVFEHWSAKYQCIHCGHSGRFDNKGNAIKYYQRADLGFIDIGWPRKI